MNTAADEGYAIAFTNTTRNFSATNPLLPRNQLFILPIRYNQNSSLPLLLYQTTTPNIVYTSLFCKIAYVGVGQVCTLTALIMEPIGTVSSSSSLPSLSSSSKSDKSFLIIINFLPSGSISSLKVIDLLLPIENQLATINSLILSG
jgi:hypothetical protein